MLADAIMATQKLGRGGHRDLRGRKFGQGCLVKGLSSKDNKGKNLWLCWCGICEREFVARSRHINKDRPGCQNCTKKLGHEKLKGESLTGLKLESGCTVLEEIPQTTKNNDRRYRVECGCGNIFESSSGRIKSKNLRYSTNRCKECANQKLSIDNLKLGRVDRRDGKWKRIARIAYKRDEYQCKLCQNSDEITAHHLDGWNWFMEGRYDLDNLITLCYDCHTNFHKAYGYGDNTAKQFAQFIENFSL